jgi:hypothetical protein
VLYPTELRARMAGSASEQSAYLIRFLHRAHWTVALSSQIWARLGTRGVGFLHRLYQTHAGRVQVGARLRNVGMTMRTVQDVVNNNLNQLQLLRMEADGHVTTALSAA